MFALPHAVYGNPSLGAAVAKFDGAWIEDKLTGDHGMDPFPTGGVLPT